VGAYSPAVFLWFVGLSVVFVWLVFRSPALDYRLVALGSALPLLDLVTGGMWVLHTLWAPVTALLVVMVATRGRPLARRRWLGVPIGMFFHLVLDGVWLDADTFWWPVFGWDLDADAPELTRVPIVLALMEVAGVVALVWLARTFQLTVPANRTRLLRTGQLPRDIARRLTPEARRAPAWLDDPDP
jgi:hypothetical protein